MIYLDRVSKSFPVGPQRRVVLDSVTATFPRDRNIGILGRNGAGKSTLLRLIAGGELPDAGRIIRTNRVSWALGFQQGFHGSTSGRANAKFVARAYRADVNKALRSVEEFSELGPYLDMPYKTYSSGMRARLAFGLSMAIEFETYLVDEILTVGDAPFQSKCAEAFKSRLKYSNVIMVSHNVASLRDYCTVGAIVRNGSIEFYDTLNQAVEAYNVDLIESPGWTSWAALNGAP